MMRQRVDGPTPGGYDPPSTMIAKPLLRDEIREQLRRLAYERRGPTSVRIEAERELARRFNVSRPSLRAAIKGLIDEGLLVQRHGSGTYILPRTGVDTVHMLVASDIKPQDPFYSEFLSELSRTLATGSMHLKVIHPEGEMVAPSEAPLIIVGLCEARILAELSRNYRHIVSTQCYPDAIDISQVYFDDYRIGGQAARVMGGLGHRHVVLLSGPAHYPSAAERKRGFVEGAAAEGLQIDVIEGKMNYASGYALGDQVAAVARQRAGVTAAFAANDWMALGLMQRIAECGLRVPKDISVIGCDDIHLAAEVNPPLATFKWDMRLLVSEVFSMIDALALGGSNPRKRVLLPADFVQRGSLAAARLRGGAHRGEAVKIAGVSLFRVKATLPESEVVRMESHSVPADLYPDLRESHRAHGPVRDLSAIYVEVLTDQAGLSGLYGPIQPAQAQVIGSSLRPFLLGRDALAGELLLDQMMRLDRHGRSGLFMTGVSPIDCALWDLRGKAVGQPVYRLLGGPTRPAVPAYASMLGHSVEPGAAARVAAEFKSAGYQAQKWFFKYGPSDGERGRALNLAMASAVREAVGTGYSLMFDAFMAWDVSYAASMARALEPLDPFWLEEPVPPERVGSFRRLKRATRVPLATGEHVYTRWQVRELLARDAVDYVQTDPDWTGGITELTKICALCSAFEVPVVAHGHSLLPALHVAASQSPAVVPMVEYLILAQRAKQWFHTARHAPVSGSLALPEGPGLGIELDPARIGSREEIS